MIRLLTAVVSTGMITMGANALIPQGMWLYLGMLILGTYGLTFSIVYSFKDEQK